MRRTMLDWRIISKAVVAGVVVFIAATLAEFDPLEIEDWKFWAIDIGGGLVRSIGAAVIAVVWVGATSNGVSAPPPTP